MKCPYCGNAETKVTDKRDSEEEGITRRRRECLKCKRRFTTYERPEIEIIVVKKDGRREDYNRDKLLQGIIKACEKRPVSRGEIEKTIGEMEEKLRKKGKEVESKFIGELVMKALKKLDKVAYIRFASVYREFKDVDDFKKELKEVS
jgi:transcriptional repressor NrdR